MGRHRERSSGMRLAYGIVVVLVAGTLFAGVAPPATATEPHVRHYIDVSHHLFLSRGATNAEINRWVPVVNQGHRDVFTSALATSNEWAGVRIDELYQRILRRPAEPGGRAYWLDQIRRGLRLEDVATYFYGSDEYWARSSRTPATFIDNLYRDLLGRGSDAIGRQYWIDQLNRGLTRSAAAANFYLSIESRTDRVTILYREVLGRAPDAGGLAYWADQLITLGDISLSAWLAASDEFYLRVTGVMPAPRPAHVTYTYEVRGRDNVGSLDAFAALAGETLVNPRGWSLGGSVAFRQVPSGGHFTLWLAAPAAVPTFSSACSVHWSCRVGRHVIINETRWNNATQSWNTSGGSLRDYRHMVVNHEAGHFLGFGHVNCGGPGQLAPVMQQQSINLQGCKHNAWPLEWERQRLANRLGIPIY